jgi:hypothetical protein
LPLSQQYQYVFVLSEHALRITAPLKVAAMSIHRSLPWKTDILEAVRFFNSPSEISSVG